MTDETPNQSVFSEHTSLDPEDWQAFRTISHQALDGMIDFLSSIRDRPLWQEAPSTVRGAFQSALPRQERLLADVLRDFDDLIKPYSVGNLHPLFMGWVHGGGTPVGMIAEMLTAGLNANCGGRNHIGIEVERQVAYWMAEVLGFPREASGLFVTGTSQANFLALLVARQKIAGSINVRVNGLEALEHPLVAYTSDQAHGCVAQAMELGGMGSKYLRPIKSDDQYRMDVAALRQAVEADIASGLRPFLVVGTVGSVHTGAIDDLDALSTIAKSYGLWFHVDGAFGILAALSSKLKPLLRGLKQADSVALDFHKWLHVPYDAGFLLVRDPVMHKRAFAHEATYLTRAPEGLAKGETWPCDLGPDLSRGFRALKTWFTIQVFGADRLAASIEQTCAMAQRLHAAIERSRYYEVVAPVPLNIVCFSVKDDATGQLNQEIIIHLQMKGLAAPSMTYLKGKPVIRCALVNHRTQAHDIDEFVNVLEQWARARFDRSA